MHLRRVRQRARDAADNTLTEEVPKGAFLHFVRMEFICVVIMGRYRYIHFNGGNDRNDKKLFEAVKMTKTEFFKIMRQQHIHADAFIDVCGNLRGWYTRLNNPCNPNAGLTNRKSLSAAESMVSKLADWLEEFRAIELAHGEALAIDEASVTLEAEPMSDEHAYGLIAQCAVLALPNLPELVEACHTEALEANAAVDAARHQEWFFGMTIRAQHEYRDTCHALALDINLMMDSELVDPSDEYTEDAE